MKSRQRGGNRFYKQILVTKDKRSNIVPIP